MTIRTQFIEKWNYTGRKRIRQRPELFTVEATARASNEAKFRIRWDINQIRTQTKIPKSHAQVLVLDAMFLGNTRRFELPSDHAEEKLVITECPDDAMIDFRLKLVSADEGTRGALLAATSWFKLKSGPGENQGKAVASGFFKLNLSDSMGEQVWKITWVEPDNPQIFLNRRYHNKFKDSAVMRCHLFPEILRGVLTGILFRNASLDLIEEGSSADDWLTFAEQRLGQTLRGEQAELPEEPDGYLRLVDDIVQEFVERKWSSGKSLLEEALK
jgi:hypothetical protein